MKQANLTDDNPLLAKIVEDAVKNTYGAVAAEVWLLTNPKDKNSMFPSRRFGSVDMGNKASLSKSYDPRHALGVPSIFGRRSGNNDLESLGITMSKSGHGGFKMEIPSNSLHSHSIGPANRTLLKMHKSGRFVDHDAIENAHFPNIPCTEEELEAIAKVSNPNHPEYIKPPELVPGTGIPGILMTETDASHFQWKEIASMANSTDPLQMPIYRLDVLAKAYSMVAGVPFCFENHKGIMLFFALKTAGTEKLSRPQNLRYMKTSADLIASIICWSTEHVEARMRTSAIVKRNDRVQEAMRKDGNEDSDDRMTFLNDMDSEILKQSWYSDFKQYFGVWLSKMAGGGTRPSGKLSSSISLFSCFGSFLMLLTVSYMNELVTSHTDGDNFVVLAPLGAFATLQYNLTSAPACQPYNAFMSQMFSMIIAVAFFQIPEDLLPVWVRTGVVPALSIGLSAKLGFTHPPAGASALVFAQMKNLEVANCLWFLFANMVAIVTSAAIINVNKSKQYPVYCKLLFKSIDFMFKILAFTLIYYFQLHRGI